MPDRNAVDVHSVCVPPGSSVASSTRRPLRREDTREFARGAGAAFVNILVTFPLNKVMFRQQLEGVSARRAAHGLYREGASYLYRGVVPPLMQRSASMALMFGLYDRYLSEIRRLWAASSPAGRVAQQAAAALAAGSTEALMAPLERVQTLLQAPQYNRTFHGTWDAFVKLRPHGVREYYRGFTSLLLRNGPSNALFFTLRQPLKDALPRARTPMGNVVSDFASGSLLGASISTLFYPVNVMKTHMQGRIGGRFESPLAALRHVYEARGHRPARLFRGVHLNFTRSCVSWGIINSTYEALGHVLGRVKSANVTVTANRRSSSFEAEAEGIDQRDEQSTEKISSAVNELGISAHEMEIEELSRSFNSSLVRGMASADAAERLEQDGPNSLTPPKTTPWWVKLLREIFGSFFAILMWLGSVLCSIGYGLRGDTDNLYLGIALAVVVTLTGIFAFLQRSKASDRVNAFRSLMADETRVIRDGKPDTIDPVNLVRGDVVELGGGDKVPADVRIISCTGDCKVNNALLTGESQPVKRSADSTNAEPLETENLLFFGTQIQSGSCRAIVFDIGDATVLGKVKDLMEREASASSPIRAEIDHFVRIVSSVAIFLGVTFFIIGLLVGTDVNTNLVFIIGIIVANVPEGLLATVTVCMTLTANRMASKMVLVRFLDAVDTLGSTTCICSDKTGTLTQNIMTVVAVSYNNEVHTTGSTFRGVESLKFDAADPGFQKLHRCMSLCNNAFWVPKSKHVGSDASKPTREFMATQVLGDGTVQQRVQWVAHGNSSEQALIKLAQQVADIEEMRDAYPRLCELPFNSKNKFMITIHEQLAAEPLIVTMKGAPERISDRCDRVWLNGEAVEFTDELRAQVEQTQVQLSKLGLRVLGFCELELPTDKYPQDYAFRTDNPNFPMGTSWRNPGEIDWAPERGPRPRREITTPLVFLGLAALIDPPRPQVPGAVKTCVAAGIRVIMVTGDHPITAKAISREVGIISLPTAEDIEDENEAEGLMEGDEGWKDPDLADAIVVPGWTIGSQTEEDRWNDILDHQQVIFARTSPVQKLHIILANQRRGEVVAVTGDCVNDAPALKTADIGVAMGLAGSDVCKEAADVILLDDNFASIVAGIEEGRLIFDNLKKSIAYTLSSNIPETAPFLSFIALQIPLPLSAILILCVDLGTDMVPAISMAWETAELDIMRRPPRTKGVERLVTRKLICFAYLQIGVVQAVAGFYTWFTVMNDYGYPPSILFGLGAFDNWGKQPLYCKVSGGVFRDLDGATSSGYDAVNGFLFWDPQSDGSLTNCIFPARNFKGGVDGGWTLAAEIARADNTQASTATNKISVLTADAVQALTADGYVEYTPWRARRSEFWNSKWLSWDVTDSGVAGLGSNVKDIIHFAHQPIGLYTGVDGQRGSDDAVGMPDAVALLSAATGTKTVYSEAQLSVVREDGKVVVNVASRQCQYEALSHAQCAYFVCILVVQWADLVICKTRMNSLYHQGMNNATMNFALLFETILCGFLCYLPGLDVIGMRPIRMLHWVPGVPFSLVIVVYDETRKYLMRKHTIQSIDKDSGQIVRDPCWLERFTYY